MKKLTAKFIRQRARQRNRWMCDSGIAQFEDMYPTGMVVTPYAAAALFALRPEWVEAASNLLSGVYRRRFRQSANLAGEAYVTGDDPYGARRRHLKYSLRLGFAFTRQWNGEWGRP